MHHAPEITKSVTCGGTCGCCSIAQQTQAPGTPAGWRLVLMTLLVFVLPLLTVMITAILVQGGELRRTGMVFGVFIFILAVLPVIFKLVFKRKVEKRNECNV